MRAGSIGLQVRRVKSEERDTVPSLPVLANNGAMNEFVSPFEVVS